jgi:hypothetical protein
VNTHQTHPRTNPHKQPLRAPTVPAHPPSQTCRHRRNRNHRHSDTNRDTTHGSHTHNHPHKQTRPHTHARAITVAISIADFHKNNYLCESNVVFRGVCRGRQSGETHGNGNALCARSVSCSMRWVGRGEVGAPTTPTILEAEAVGVDNLFARPGCCAPPEERQPACNKLRWGGIRCVFSGSKCRIAPMGN